MESDTQFDPAQTGTREILGHTLTPLMKSTALGYEFNAEDGTGPYWEWHSPNRLSALIFAEGSDVLVEHGVDHSDDEEAFYRTWLLVDHG